MDKLTIICKQANTITGNSFQQKMKILPCRNYCYFTEEKTVRFFINVSFLTQDATKKAVPFTDCLAFTINTDLLGKGWHIKETLNIVY